MLLNHLFQWLLCFQRCSPPQSPPTTIHSPSTADPLKGLCGLQMQIKSSGAYQLCSKKKRKINHFWGCLANKWLKRRQIKGILWSRGGRPKLTRMRLASLTILINFRKQLQLWIDNWTVFCVCFWLVVLWMSLCRKWWGREHGCIGKCVSAPTQLVKCFHSLCLKVIVIIFVLLSPVSVCPDAGIFTG